MADLQGRKVLVDDTRSFIRLSHVIIIIIIIIIICIFCHVDVDVRSAVSSDWLAGECGAESEELAEGSARALPLRSRISPRRSHPYWRKPASRDGC